MCCFSRPVQRVEKTSIYARRSAPGRQVLVYSATVTARERLAMILPLPVPPGSGEGAVRFVALDGYPDLMRHVARGFEPLMDFAARSGAPLRAPQHLRVHQVGAFEASFVPTVRDFSRLDPRFSLPRSVWEALPAYADYGFAVFQLSGFERSGLTRLFARGATKTIHPMALELATRDPDRLFFPTVHVHDGEVHADADFDHVLYCEADRVPDGWEASECPLGEVVDVAKTKGLVDGDKPAARRVLQGSLPNTDTWVA